MNPFFTTLSVARYEATVLLRSWFLRIVAPLTLIIVVLLDYVVFVRPEVPWFLNALPSYIPYLNLLLFNVMQAVIAVFLATEFLKDDQKLDVTEVIYPHSMTNAEYVVGKMLGALGVFGLLNVLALGIGLVFNAFYSGLPISVAAYLLYPLLISLPTLVFVFGLSFLLMTLIRSQAITIILLAGYIVATLFYLGGFRHNLFDFMSFRLPLAYSEFVGFGDLSGLLAHRGVYFLLGLGFILLTMRLLRRLPQSRLIFRMSTAMSVLLIAGGLYLGWFQIQKTNEATVFRSRMAELNSEIRTAPAVSLRKCNLELEHLGHEIKARASLHLVNNTSGPLEICVFSLNPGLEVGSVEKNGAPVPFERNLHILVVRLPDALDPGMECSLTVSYRGRIDERVCYPDIDDKIMSASNRILLYNMGKRYAFVRPDYVLLTPECLWYPRAGLSEGAAWPEVPPLDFVDFNLVVKTAEGLRVISQGELIEKGPGEFEFRPETPLPYLSLAIGEYEKMSLAVDDTTVSGGSTVVSTTEYSIYLLKGHDFFSEHLTAIDSLVPEIIRGTRAQYETRLGLEYPYRRFSLVETPFQFYAYPRSWKTGSETVQPELVFMPEKAVNLQAVLFNKMTFFLTRMGGNRMPEEVMQRNVLQQFINSTFLTDPVQSRTMQLASGGGFFTSRIDYTYCPILPMYGYYVHHISSSRWPFLNLALENRLSRQSVTEQEIMTSVMFRGLTGMSMEDWANLSLSERPLSEILARPGADEDVQLIMKAKCDQLLNLLRGITGEQEFNACLNGYFESHMFRDTDAGDLVSRLSQLCNEDLAPRLDSWLHGTSLPAYTFSSPKQFEVLDGDRKRYQILLTVTNDSDTDGVVGVNIVWSKGGNFEQMWGSRPQNPADERFHEVKAGQSREIGIVLDQEIHALWVNAGLSRNLPASKALFFSETPAPKDYPPFEGERETAGAVLREDPGVIIVDNEDAGFELQGEGKQSFLKGLVTHPESKSQKYVGLLHFRPPSRWSKALYGAFYGKHRLSGCYIASGNGRNKAVWKADLPRHGNYELCCHTLELPARAFYNPSGKPRIKDFHFTVHDDDGQKQMSVDLENASSGWYSLGTFYFSAGEARVELSDQSKGQIVYADAMRWTLRE